jgi:peptidoglycan/LPS O-acetylase OafA/YrhL
VLRVWPALTLLLLGTLFVVGPLLSRYDLADYFTHPATYRYLWENLLLTNNQYLPGVFAGHSPPMEINSSLWTLSYEVGCYTALLVLFALKITTRPWLCAGVALLLFAEPLLPHSLIFPGMEANYQVRYLPSAFALGALLAAFKDRITLGLETPLVAALLFIPLKTTVVGQLLFFVLLFLTLLYASALPWVRKLRLPADLSYGTYLWGFLIQQIVASQFADLGFIFNLITSLLLSLLLAFLSWHLVEKRAIAAGHRWAKKFLPNRTPAEIPA